MKRLACFEVKLGYSWSSTKKVLRNPLSIACFWHSMLDKLTRIVVDTHLSHLSLISNPNYIGHKLFGNLTQPVKAALSMYSGGDSGRGLKHMAL